MRYALCVLTAAYQGLKYPPGNPIFSGHPNPLVFVGVADERSAFVQGGEYVALEIGHFP